MSEWWAMWGVDALVFVGVFCLVSLMGAIFFSKES